MDEFETLDTNADGLVSFAEFTHAKRLVFRHSFNEMDDNKDGFVTRNEHRAEAVFNEMDANRDQHVTFYEFQELKIARHKVRFKKKDKNKDGYLTRPEFESGRVKSKKKKRPMGTPYPKSPLGEHRF